MSRTPNSRLVNNPQAIRLRLSALQRKAKQLEGEPGTKHDWEKVLSSFRELTMSITASGSSIDSALAIQVYEAASDAACNGDDWEKFHLFRSRLCSDLYPTACKNGENRRELDFKVYSVLFFGCRVQDMRDVTKELLTLTAEEIAAPAMRRAIECVRCVMKTKDGVRFLELYNASDITSKKILFHQLKPMREVAAACIVSAYMSIEVEYARSLLRLDSSEATRQAIFAMKPGLEQVNVQSTDTLILRIRR